MNPYNWNNRIAYFFHNFLDSDCNGYLDKKDFENVALRLTINQLKGSFKLDLFNENQRNLNDLWKELLIDDKNKDNIITQPEFKEAMQKMCMGKSFNGFPKSLQSAILAKFRSMDKDGDDLISLEEYRLELVNNKSVYTIEQIDDCWKKLLNEDDQRRGGINSARYFDLWSQFLGSTSEKEGIYILGPLSMVN